MGEPARPVDPDASPERAQRPQHLVRQEFGVAEPGRAFDDDRDQFGGGVGIGVARARFVRQRIIVDQDFLVKRGKIGPVHDGRGVETEFLSLQAALHAQKLPDQNFILGPAAPFGDEIGDGLVQRFDLTEHDGAPDRDNGQRLGQRHGRQRRLARHGAEIIRRLKNAAAPDEESGRIVAPGIIPGRFQRAGIDGAMCFRRRRQRPIWLGAGDRLHRVIERGHVAGAIALEALHIERFGVGRRQGLGSAAGHHRGHHRPPDDPFHANPYACAGVAGTGSGAIRGS